MKNLFPLISTCLLLLVSTGAFSGTPANTTGLRQTGPHGFIENKGQIHDQYRQPNNDVKYLYCSPGFNVQLRAHGFSYDTYSEIPGEIAAPPPLQKPTVKIKLPAPPPIRKYHRVDIELIGSNPSPEITASGKSEVYMNYITDVESQQAIGDIHDYQQVLYKDIYPHIDLEFRLKQEAGNGPKAEYDFIVHPGGDASLIKLKYNGANSIGLEDTHLKVEVATGVFNEAIPHSYLKSGNKEIQVKYIRTGTNTFSFSVPGGHYNSDLIIDPAPTLLWCTYYGGSGEEGASSITETYLNGGIALDDTGNVYVTGFTLSASNIATSGAYQSSYNGSQEPFLAKFNPSGCTLLWGTYIDGGTCTVIAASPPTGTGVGCDAAGNVYFVGITYTGQNVFIAKLSGTGAFDWSATCGGDGAFIFGGPGIAVQPDGTVYVTGSNGVAYGPCYFAWYSQGFIAKYNTSGVQQWLHEVGPLTTSPADVFTSGNGIVLDANSNIYITGMTSAASGIATAGTYLQTYGAGYGDNGGSVYVAKFDSTGAQQWGTYYAGITSCCFGGVNNEGASIAVDNTGVYITGVTCQNSGVATSGTYKTSFSGTGGNNANIFVAKFSLTGGLDWGTYYGGAGSTTSSGPDAGMGIATDGNGNVYVTGGTTSAANIASAGTLEPTLSGTSNAFLANFDAASGALTWGTYFHGTSSATTLGTGIVLNGKGKLFMVGETTESSGLSTPGVWQPNYGGAQDVFVASFSVGSIPLNATVHIKQPACSGETNDTVTVNASGGTPPYSYLWTPGGQTTDSVTSLGAGTYTVKVTDFANATVVDTITIIQPTPVSAGAISATEDAICNGDTEKLTVTGNTASVQWQSSSTGNNFTNINGADSANYYASASENTYYRVYAAIGSCSDTSSPFQLKVNALPMPVVVSSDSIICSSDSALIQTTFSYPSYLWNNADTGSHIYANAAGAYWVTVTDTNDCSAISNHVNLAVYPVSSVSIITRGDTLSSYNATGYQWYLDNVAIPGATTNVYIVQQAGNYSVQVTDTNGCSNISSPVYVVPTAVEDMYLNNQLVVYPNPTSGMVYVSLPNGSYVNEARIFNVMGQEVTNRVTLQTNANRFEMDIRDLPAGAYELKISDNGKYYTNTILKFGGQ